MIAEQPLLDMEPSREPLKLRLDYQCPGCLGFLYYFWYENRHRREVYQCADAECRLLYIHNLDEKQIPATAK